MLLSAPISSYLITIPEFFLGVSLIFLTLIALFLKNNSFKFTHYGALIAVGVTLSLLQFIGGAKGVNFNGFFIHDPYSFYIKTFILLFVFSILVFTTSSLSQEYLSHYEYPLLILSSTLGMLIMVSSNDLLTVFVAIEILSLSLYILIAFKKDSAPAKEASLKYFILGAFSTGLLLYGVSFIYGFSGTTHFGILESFFKSQSIIQSPTILFGFSLILVSLIFKLSIAPFHLWVADVYHGTPTPLVSFLVSAPKLAVFALLLRLLAGPFSQFSFFWTKIILIVSIFSMIAGAYAALTQQHIKRFIAYSSVGQMGFCFIGLSIGNESGYETSLYFFIFYISMMLGLFSSLLHLSKRGYVIETLSDLNGLGHYHPLVSFCLSFFILSLSGIPPFPGFLPKFLILKSALSNEAYLISIIGCLYSVIAAAYYLFFIKAIFFDKPTKGSNSLSTLKTQNVTSLIFSYFLLFLILCLFIYPEPLLNWTTNAASCLVFL